MKDKLGGANGLILPYVLKNTIILIGCQFNQKKGNLGLLRDLTSGRKL